jgi:cysteinyl-tRNA synthetase
MSPLQIHNTLSNKKELFTPINGKTVKIYACGPTVYDLSHLGHARSAITWDMVVRYLRFSGYDVIFTRNITDIDDKIINRAKELGIRPEQVAREYTFGYWRDMKALNIGLPDFEPRATEYLSQMIAFIDQLIKAGHAYASEGDVYFDVSSFKEYGKLKKQRLEDMLVGARDLAVSQQDLQERKKSPLDFALWKGAAAGETGWQTPWGFGRPGWHLECSTMIADVLGDTIDIHGGGEDLVFPHNENEIAQSEALHKKPLARYWMHNGMVNIDAEKMSKSLGNFKTIQDLLQTYSPDTIRLFILQTHYRSPLEFTAESLQAVKNGLQRLIRAANGVSQDDAEKLASQMQVAESAFTKEELRKVGAAFAEAMDNDFNTAEAVAVLYGLADQINTTAEIEKRLSHIYALQLYAGVLGLTLEDTSQNLDSATSQEIMSLVLQIRQEARAKKDYATSDLIRNKLGALGINVMDTAGNGAAWERS